MFKWLGQIIVTTSIKPFDNIPRVRFGCHQNHRYRAQELVLLQLPQDADAVTLGHHNVEQDQIGRQLPGACQALFTIGCGHDLVAVGLQSHAQNLQILLRIVDGENQRGIAHASLLFRGVALGLSPATGAD